jgi:hypothetical protein
MENLKEYCEYNLQLQIEVTEKQFQRYLDCFNVDCAKWVQYEKHTIFKGRVYFHFCNSQNSIKFKIQGQPMSNEYEYDMYLGGKFKYIYEKFRVTKYTHLEKNGYYHNQ